jgi:hypothetical protein
MPHDDLEKEFDTLLTLTHSQVARASVTSMKSISRNSLSRKSNHTRAPGLRDHWRALPTAISIQKRIAEQTKPHCVHGLTRLGNR